MPRDYDELDEYENPQFRWVSMIVLVLAVAGFLSLAWYAYQTGADHALNGDVVVIEADDRPIKEVPEDRGGMDFPHQDKTIYNVLKTPSGEDEKVTVIAVPEEPKMPTAPAPKQERESADRKVAQIIQKAVEDTQRDMKLQKPLAEKVNAPKPEPVKPAEEPVKAEPEKEEPKKPLVIEKPMMKNPEPVAKEEPETVKEEPKPEPQKVEQPEPVKDATPASDAQLQLGAFRSESDATAQWNKIQSANKDVLGGLSHHIVRADLKEKGIYYRLRASGFASKEAAEKACKTLSGRKQACFVVK